MHNIKKFLNRYRNNGHTESSVYEDDNNFSAFMDKRMTNSDNTLTRRKMNNFTIYNAANYSNLQYGVEKEIANNKFATTNATNTTSATTTAIKTSTTTQNQSRAPRYKNVNNTKGGDIQPSSRLRAETIDSRKKSTPISIMMPPPPPDHPPVPYNKPKPLKYQQFDDLYSKVNKPSKKSITTTTTDSSTSDHHHHHHRATTNNKKITNKPTMTEFSPIPKHDAENNKKITNKSTMTKHQIISPLPIYDVKNKENDYIHLDGFYYKECDVVTDLDEVDDFNVKECDREVASVMTSCNLTDICTSLSCGCYESNYENDIVKVGRSGGCVVVGDNNTNEVDGESFNEKRHNKPFNTYGNHLIKVCDDHNNNKPTEFDDKTFTIEKRSNRPQTPPNPYRIRNLSLVINPISSFSPLASHDNDPFKSILSTMLKCSDCMAMKKLEHFGFCTDCSEYRCKICIINNGVCRNCVQIMNKVLIMYHDGIRFRVKIVKRKDFFRR
jgi:hypothetical protein